MREREKRISFLNPNFLTPGLLARWRGSNSQLSPDRKVAVENDGPKGVSAVD